MTTIEQKLLQTSFEFLYWFSRFEYTLKENGYFFKDRYNNALPNWNKFIEDFENKYHLTREASLLLHLKPQKQIVNNNELDWEEPTLGGSDLNKTIQCIKIVRNNLFHGGKHLSTDKERDLKLISHATSAIKQIAYIDNFGMEVFEPYQEFSPSEIFKEIDEY